MQVIYIYVHTFPYKSQFFRHYVNGRMFGRRQHAKARLERARCRRIGPRRPSCRPTRRSR